jgi:hypothetical protein
MRSPVARSIAKRIEATTTEVKGSPMLLLTRPKAMADMIEAS